MRTNRLEAISDGVLAMIITIMVLELKVPSGHHIADRTLVIIYGLNLLAAAVAYLILQATIIRQEGADSPLRQAVSADVKAKVSNGLLVAGVLSAAAITPDGHVGVWIALASYIGVAVIWIVPDRRIDRLVPQHQAGA